MVGFIISCFIEITVFNANSVDSDLGLHCLPMSLIRDAMHVMYMHLYSLAHLVPLSVSPLYTQPRG